MFNVHQRWHCARSRTGAAKPTLWPTLNPCHFTVLCFIFKTLTFSFSSKQALSNNVFGVKIGRTITLRRLFKVINFRRSKFVCTLWPCPVFGMRAAGLATHLTTPVCPVARTQTIILQVVYSMATQDRSWLRTVQFRIGRTRKRLLLLFFSFLNCCCCLCVVRRGKFLLCGCRSGAVDAMHTCAWAVLFFRPCFSKKLPTTCSEQCCSLVVVQRIFQHIKKTSASLGSVFSLSSFSFSFLVVEQVRLFLLPFSFVRGVIGRSVVVNLYRWF